MKLPMKISEKVKGRSFFGGDRISDGTEGSVHDTSCLVSCEQTFLD
jgi:hypothetical protein